MVWQRPECRWRGVVALAAMLFVAGWGPTPASADVLGGVDVAPVSGSDETLVSGVVNDVQCPAGTTDSFFDVIGPDIGTGAARGAGEIGFLGQAARDGRGESSFVGSSIANLRTVSAGAFAATGRYHIRLRCERGAATTDTYATALDYTAGGMGSFTVQAPRPASARPAVSGPPGAASKFPAPATADGGATSALGGAATAVPKDVPTPVLQGAATPAAGANTPGTSGLDVGTPGTPTPARAASSSIGWLALAVLGVGAVVLLERKRRRWFVAANSTQPNAAGAGRR